MPHEPDNAVPSPRGREGPRHNLLLLVSCILGLLAGLCVFGFACYLLTR
jgi:hypothetical protein